MNLMFVVFVLGTCTIELTDQLPPDVTFDLKTGLWHVGKETYNLDTGVRVPEGREFFGAMMVLRRPTDRPLDLSRVRAAMVELRLEWASSVPALV